MTRITTQLDPEKLISLLDDDFFDEYVSEQILAAQPFNGADVLYEIVNGRPVEKQMGFYESGIASILGYFLEHLARLSELGRVRIETLFRIDATQKLDRRPDVAFISYQRWPKNRRLPRTNAGEIVPNLAVEIISLTNRAEEVVVRLQEYFRAGVQLVWVVYPRQRQVYVYDAPDRVRIVNATEELDGGSLLPGFRLPVALLFEDEPESEESV